jgi:Fe-S-cluster containining protein
MTLRWKKNPRLTGLSSIGASVPIGELSPVPVSLCDHCVKPGHCCRDIYISSQSHSGTFYADEWPAAGLRWLDDAMPGHPFSPLRLEVIDPADLRHDQNAGRPYGFGRWSCRNLAPSGRCGDYENRPELCKAYEPASDGLCVMYMPPVKAEL